MLKFNFSPVYFLIDSPPHPGGDENAGGAGAGDGGQSSGSAGLSKEEVADLVNRTVNNAISNLKKGDLPKMFKEHLTPLGQQLTSVTETLSGLASRFDSSSGGQGGGNGNQQGGGSSQSGSNAMSVPPEINAQIKRMDESLKQQTQTIEQLKKEKEESDRKAELAEKTSFVRNSMGVVEYASKAAQDTAFSLISPHVQKLDDGTFIAGENLPVDEFIKDFMTREHSYLLKPVSTNGTGARPGQSSGGKGVIAIEDIKPGMTAEQRARAFAAVQAAAQQANSQS